MVFVFYQFSTPPLFFNPVESAKIRSGPYASEYAALEGKYDEAFREKSQVLQSYLDAERSGDKKRILETGEQLREADKRAEGIRASALQVLKKNDGSVDTNDTNYIFLSFVMKYLPVGLVGLIFACIFAASMSSSSGELSALATSSVVDVYKRHFKKVGTDQHYLTVSRISMALWGIYGIAFAQYASRLGSLVEAVNILGSLFYGTMLGVFLLAFYFKSVGGTPTFIAAFVGEAVVLCCFQFTQIAWLWYNVIGCGVLVIVALLINPFFDSKPADKKAPSIAR
jgi:Na+/proline symporter